VRCVVSDLLVTSAPSDRCVCPIGYRECPLQSPARYLPGFGISSTVPFVLMIRMFELQEVSEKCLPHQLLPLRS
jgi:hypothetical protein